MAVSEAASRSGAASMTQRVPVVKLTKQRNISWPIAKPWKRCKEARPFNSTMTRKQVAGHMR